MELINEAMGLLDLDLDLFIWTKEFYLVCTFLTILALGYAGTYLITDEENDQ